VESIALFLAAIVLCVGVFMMFRAVVLWYWRVDEILATLKSIDQKLTLQASPGPGSVTEQIQLSCLQSINLKLGVLTEGKAVAPKADQSDSAKSGADPLEYAPKD
jgi:hypothetical protein